MARFHELRLTNGTTERHDWVDNQLIGEPVKAGARVQLIKVSSSRGNSWDWFRAIRNEGATSVVTGMDGWDTTEDEGTWEIVEVVC